MEIFWDEVFTVRNTIKAGQSWCSAVICRIRCDFEMQFRLIVVSTFLKTCVKDRISVWHNNLMISTFLPIDKSFMNSSCESLNLRFVNKFTFFVQIQYPKGENILRITTRKWIFQVCCKSTKVLIVLLFWNIWRKRNITLVKGALRIASLQTVKFKKILQLQMKLHSITMYLCWEDLNLTVPKYFKPVILFKDSSCCK